MNKVILIGRLTADPELRYLPNSGTAVCRFTLAIDKDLSKEKKAEAEAAGKPTADFIDIVAWGNKAEFAADKLAKGLKTGIEGRIEKSIWEDKDGGGTRSKTEVILQNLEMIDWKTEKAAEGELPWKK